MWLIKKWDSKSIDIEASSLYAPLEEEMYMKITEGMVEVLEEDYTCKDILPLIKSIYGLVRAERFWFKECIKAMTPKAGFKQCKTDSCLLYRLNKLGTSIVIVYINITLEISNTPA